VIDILAKVEKRPEKERTYPEILELRRRLIKSWQTLAIGRMREISKFLLRETESFG